MINPLRSSRALENSRPDDVVLTLRSSQMVVTVTHDGFSIGSDRHCDLRLDDATVPAIHSIIHNQNGAMWIEAADFDDTSKLIINDRPRRRMSLRQGDRIDVGATVFRVELGSLSQEKLELPPLPGEASEDLTSLTAEELCDRIQTEHSMIEEFTEGQKSGWEALLNAIEAVHEEPVSPEIEKSLRIPLVEDQGVYNTLLGEIQQLQNVFEDRSKHLDDQENEIAASSSILEESQQRVSQQLDELLDRLSNNESTNEFRASA
jgi:hypothetical protein